MEGTWRHETERIHGSESDARDKKRRLSLHTTRRVLAPYVKARHKPKVEHEENKFFNFYVQKKPSILLSDMTHMIYEGDDLLNVIDESANMLKEITESAEVLVYMVDSAVEEIYQLRIKTGTENHRVSFKIETETTVAAYVAATRQWVKIRDLLEDVRFPCGLGHNEVTVKSVLCVPVLTPEDECLAVIQLHRDMDDGEYDDIDLHIVSVMCAWIGATIYQNQQKLSLQRQQELNEYLLDICKCYFADAMLLEKLMAEVIHFAKTALNAEHGAFFIIKENDNIIFADYYEESIDPNKNYLNKRRVRIRTGTDTDILGQVLTTGLAVNVKNAYRDGRVDQDRKRGYIIRSVLCVPINNGNTVMGVLQVINKRRGVYFTKNDEILLTTFSDYCGFVLKYASSYEEMKKNKNMNSVYREMLEQHMLPCVHDYYLVSSHPKPPSIPPHFYNFAFVLTEEYVHYAPQLVMYMFDQLSLETFDNMKVKCKFVLTVQKSYKDLPYHNFQHAFYVLHTTFCIIQRNKDILSLNEARAMMIAAYCHDVDHTGTSNQFLELNKHYLAELYDDSYLENHHFHVTVFIIQLLKLFQYLSEGEYEELLGEIKFCIFSTDISTYLKNRKYLLNMCRKGINWQNNIHKDLLKSLVMTMSDLSEYCKPFTTSKNIIDARYKEDYEEGDQSKKKGFCPISMYDRDKSNSIAADQVQFMSLIVLPCAEMLAKILPNCSALQREAEQTKQSWTDMKDIQGQKLWSLEGSLPDKKVVKA